MNVMWIDEDLDVAAQNHPTKYTKLILEAGQCLCSALHNSGVGELSPYGPGYNHHPISRWAGDSKQNWFYLQEYMSALHNHYYGYTYDEIASMDEEDAWSLWEDGEVHKTVVQIATANVDKVVDIMFPDIGITARPKCVVDFCKEESVTETYRKYFTCLKQHYDWFEWSDGEPEWLSEYEEKYATEYEYGKEFIDQ